MSDESNGLATLIALDPGGTTGWCVMAVHPEALVADDVRILDNVMYWQQGQIYGDEVKQELELLELMESWPSVPLLVERFVLRKYLKSEELLSPVRVTAVLRFLAESGIVPVRRPVAYQQPSDAMNTATDLRLKEWGYYKADGEEHARDATRHAIVGLRRAKGQKTGVLRKQLWPGLYGPGGAWADPKRGEDAEEGRRQA